MMIINLDLDKVGFVLVITRTFSLTSRHTETRVTRFWVSGGRSFPRNDVVVSTVGPEIGQSQCNTLTVRVRGSGLTDDLHSEEMTILSLVELRISEFYCC